MNSHPIRKIIHIDMDAFYASIEQRDNPAYRGKPIVVGGPPTGRGGVVATASYEARAFGVRSAMTSKRAQQLCPHVIFVYPRFEAYKQVSKQIREIFYQYTDLVEPLSLDEAYLDVTTDKLGVGSAIEIAKRIKQQIYEDLHLTASAGVSINKFVAKIASDLHKPNGLTFIGPSRVSSFIEQLPVEKFFGVGKVTAAKMKSMNLFTGKDLKALSESELVQHFGKTGRFYFSIVRGEDNRPVEPNRETKSVGAEDTFLHDLTQLDDLKHELNRIAAQVVKRLNQYQLSGRTLTLKVKYHDFKQITRSKSFTENIHDLPTIAQFASDTIDQVFETGDKIRLLGLSVSNFAEPVFQPVSPKNQQQLQLF
ncbi:MAG: DNA polymerase IV [Chryseotalea sp.]